MHFDEAKALHLSGNVEAALVAYRTLLAQQPEDAACWNMLGNALFDRKEFTEAVQAYRKAIALRPGWGPPHFNLGNTLFAMDLLDDAIAAYQKAIACDPQQAAAHFNLGNVHYDRGQWEQAVQAYRAAAAVASPPDADIVFNLGKALFELGRFPEALQALQEATRLAPGMPQAFGTLGLTWFELDRPQEAALAHQQALDLDPDCATEHFSLARAQMTLGQWAEAEQSLLRTLQLNPLAGPAYELLGRIYLDNNASERLPELLQRWQRAVPGDPRLEHLRAAWTGEGAAARASDDYVRTVFDNFASTFDNTLRKLKYRAPQLTADALRRVVSSQPLGRLLDAGCGTGLCGPLLRSLGRHLIGVDLSRGMIEVATQRGVYDELITAELTQYLRQAGEPFDAIVSADTLVYFGDLADLFAAAHRALAVGGWLVFTVERVEPGQDGSTAGYQLTPSGRFAHDENYVRRMLEAAGFRDIAAEEVVLREEGGNPVIGFLVESRR